MPLQSDYLERLYAGFLGKNVGIRLGAPVEPAIWTFQRIRAVYGEVTSYLKPYRTFAADDDANGPVFFIRPLVEGDPARPLEPGQVARAWLDYARDGKGMFWWGGYGVSTEHTAYLNLKAGIPAPESGSIARNGARVAEQIGGQIFVDTWGLVWPGRPDEAATNRPLSLGVLLEAGVLYGERSPQRRGQNRTHQPRYRAGHLECERVGSAVASRHHRVRTGHGHAEDSGMPGEGVVGVESGHRPHSGALPRLLDARRTAHFERAAVEANDARHRRRGFGPFLDVFGQRPNALDRCCDMDGVVENHGLIF